MWDKWDNLGFYICGACTFAKQDPERLSLFHEYYATINNL